MTKPGYGEWVYHLCRKWQPPRKHTLTRAGREVTVRVDVPKLIGVAVMMASWGKDGSDIYPSAEKIAPHADMSVRQVKDLRQLAVSLGMFRVTGKSGRSQILEIATPPDAMVQDSAPSWCGIPHPTYVNPMSNLSNSDGAESRTIQTRSSATGQDERSESYESSDGAESRTLNVPQAAPIPETDYHDTAAGWHHRRCDCATCRQNRAFTPDQPRLWQRPVRRCQCADCKETPGTL
jgi:hypothetical protein